MPWIMDFGRSIDLEDNDDLRWTKYKSGKFVNYTDVLDCFTPRKSCASELLEDH